MKNILLSFALLGLSLTGMAQTRYVDNVFNRNDVVITPNVPFTKTPAPASNPSRYRFKPATSNLSPVPKNGINNAKKIKGISINARLNIRVNGIFAAATVIRRAIK